MDFHFRPVRHLVPVRRGRQQARRLPGGEHHRGHLPGGAVHPGVRHHQPRRHLGPRVGQVQEGFPGEEISLHEFHAGFDPGLIPRMPDPGRVGDEPPRLGVLQPLPGQPRIDRVRLRHDRAHIVRDDHPEHPAEKLPGVLAPGDDLLQRHRERQVHEQVPGKARGEHQRVQLAAPALRRPGSAPDTRNRPAARRPAARHRPAWSPWCRPPRTARPRTGAASAPPPPRPAGPASSRS